MQFSWCLSSVVGLIPSTIEPWVGEQNSGAWEVQGQPNARGRGGERRKLQEEREEGEEEEEERRDSMLSACLVYAKP